MGVSWQLKWLLAAAALTLISGGRPYPTMAEPQVLRPTKEPILRIEPGMHTAVIPRIGVDRSCRLMATASDDKTVRLWSLPALRRGKPRVARLQDTLRPPIGAGDQGKIYAVAVSPSANWVAAGGNEAPGGVEGKGKGQVYIFAADSGHMINSLGQLSTVILHLTFSSDGRYLAATLGTGGGVRVWQSDTWQLVGKDENYDGKNSSRAAFDAQGRLYTVALDGNLRRYDPPFTLEMTPTVRAEAIGGSEPYGIAAHPDGDRLAVGFHDTPNVSVVRTEDLEPLLPNPLFASESGMEGTNSMAVAWSRDGRRLYAGGRNNIVGGRIPFHVWKDAGRGEAQALEGPLNTIWDLLPCGPYIAVGAQDPAFGLIDRKGERRIWRDPVTPDLRKALREHFTVSTDGKRVQFGLKIRGRNPILLDLVENRLEDPPRSVAGLSAADTESLRITSWEDNLSPALNGKPLAMDDEYEEARSLAIAPKQGHDKTHFVLGAEGTLRAYDRNGQPIWIKEAPAIVWGVNSADDGRLIIAAYGDGTIRWHRAEDGEELLALFVYVPDDPEAAKRWILWTPKGYYTASPGGEDLIGWHVNRGPEVAADFFAVSQFRDQFYRPDVVTKVLDTLDEEEAIIVANREREVQNDVPRACCDTIALDVLAPDLKTILPPVVTVTDINDGDPVDSDEIAVNYRVRSPSGLPISRVFALVDGLPVKGAEDRRQKQAPENEEIKDVLKFKLPEWIKVPKRKFSLTILAESKGLTSKREDATVRLPWKGPASPVETPVLYALLIGAGEYDEDEYDLGDFPANDVDRLAKQLLNQKGLAFREVRIRILKDRQEGLDEVDPKWFESTDGNTAASATKDNIEAGLQWLMNVKQDDRDIALVFFSGHGKTTGVDARSPSYLLPVDFDPNDNRTRLNKQTLAGDLFEINGKKLLILDACYAGKGAFNTTLLGEEFSKQGIMIIASSLGTERSYADDKGSFFARALIEALEGGDEKLKADGEIMTNELEGWAKRRVRNLIEFTDEPDRRQTPFILKPPGSVDLRLAVTPQ